MMQGGGVRFDHWHFGGDRTAGVNLEQGSAHTCHLGEHLLYPGLPRPVVKVTLTFTLRIEQFRPDFPLCFLEVYADDTLPRRFSLYAGVEPPAPELRLRWAHVGSRPTPALVGP